VSSPPDEGSRNNGGAPEGPGAKSPRDRARYASEAAYQRSRHPLPGADGTAYGATEGQLGALPAGAPPRVAADGVVSSPPWEGTINGTDVEFVEKMEAEQNPGPRKVARKTPPQDYGNTEGQLGNAAGTTFWEAARDVLLSTHAVCKPGSVTCWVTKPFVRRRKLVDFPGDWTRLLAACGFAPFLTAHALLDRVTAEPSLFGGEERTVRSRRSFFRRLAEKKGAPPINSEQVVFARRV
jgi:hypothetical protein